MDFERVDSCKRALLDPEDPDQPIIKCVVVMNRFRALSEWWERRGDRDISSISAVQDATGVAMQQFKSIQDYLTRPDTLVGRLPWWEGEGEESEWVYEVLYAIMR